MSECDKEQPCRHLMMRAIKARKERWEKKRKAEQSYVQGPQDQRTEGHVGFLHSITQVVLAVRQEQKLPVTKLSFKLYTSGPSPCIPVASREVLWGGLTPLAQDRNHTHTWPTQILIHCLVFPYFFPFIFLLQVLQT